MTARRGSFFATVYQFTFGPLRRQLLLDGLTFVVAMSYVAVNVLWWGRDETRVLYEGAGIAALLTAGLPLLTCWYRWRRYG